MPLCCYSSKENSIASLYWARLCHEKSHSFVCVDCRKRYIQFKKGCTDGISSFINKAELGTFNTDWLSLRGKEINAI